jgi:dTDP-4-dehydrorhamnose reductase
VDWGRDCGAPVKASKIVPILSSEYPTPAMRPANSRLDTRKLQEAFALVMPDWQELAQHDVQSIVATL